MSIVDSLKSALNPKKSKHSVALLSHDYLDESNNLNPQKYGIDTMKFLPQSRSSVLEEESRRITQINTIRNSLAISPIKSKPPEKSKNYTDSPISENSKEIEDFELMYGKRKLSSSHDEDLKSKISSDGSYGDKDACCLNLKQRIIDD